MKRILALALALLLTLGACASAEENWYLDTACELAQCVSELAGDQGYLSLVEIPDNEYVKAFYEAGCEELQEAYQLTIPVNALMLLMKFADLSPETEVGKESVKARLAGILVTMNNGSIGVDALTASSMLTFSRAYPMPEGFETQIVALDYGNTTVAVSFAQTGEDTITANAQPLFFRDENKLESWFESMKSAGISIEKIF